MGGVLCGPASRIRGGVALSEAKQVATMKETSIIVRGHRSASLRPTRGLCGSAEIQVRPVRVFNIKGMIRGPGHYYPALPTAR